MLDGYRPDSIIEKPRPPLSGSKVKTTEEQLVYAVDKLVDEVLKLCTIVEKMQKRIEVLETINKVCEDDKDPIELNNLDKANGTLVICDTLKQADILFERYCTLLREGFVAGAARRIKSRREVRFIDGQYVLFTSTHNYEVRDRHGFTGQVIDGRRFDKMLDNDEQILKGLKQNV